MLKVLKSKKRSDYSWIKVPMDRLITVNLSQLAKCLGISRQRVHLWTQKNGYIYVPSRYSGQIKKYLR